MSATSTGGRKCAGVSVPLEAYPRITVSILVSLALGTPAFAQQTSATEAGGGLEEVVVTAQKRTEKLQDVPLSIGVVGMRDLEQQGVGRLEDVAKRVAGLALIPGTHRAQYTIRGITTATVGVTTSSAAGLFVDDYPLYDTWFPLASPDPRVIDVERIEVLRGPQGTLHGASSLSGDVRIITAKPDLQSAYGKVELMGAAIGGGSEDFLASGVLNLPFADGRAALRAVAWTRQDGGFIDVPGRNNATDVNEATNSGARLHLKFEASDRLSVLATASYETSKLDDQPLSFYFNSTEDAQDQWKSPGVAQPVDSDYLTVGVSAAYDLGWSTLSLSGTYGKNTGKFGADTTELSFLFAGAPLVPEYNYIAVDSDSQIFEAQLTSSGDGAFRYVAGVNLAKRNNEQLYHYFSDRMIPRYGTNVLYYVPVDNDSTESAIYGQASWRFAERWEATAGLRYSKLDYTSYFNLSGVLASPVNPTRQYITDIENNDSALTPRVSLAYKPSPQANLYFTASKGFRFGLTNYNTGSSTGVPLQYKPDELWNYELGAKMALLDGRMSLNTALYYIDWKDLQVPFRNPNTGGTIYVANAGTARSYGLEAELTAQPSDRWEFNASLMLGKAEIAADTPGVPARAASARGPALFGVTEGMRLPGSPKVTGSLGIQYTLPKLGAGEPYARIDASYVGSSYVDFEKTGSLEIGGFTTTNVRLGYSFGQYEVVAFINNALDERGIANAFVNANRLLTDAAFRQRPRTVGVTLRAAF